MTEQKIDHGEARRAAEWATQHPRPLVWVDGIAAAYLDLRRLALTYMLRLDAPHGDPDLHEPQLLAEAEAALRAALGEEGSDD